MAVERTIRTAGWFAAAIDGAGVWICTFVIYRDEARLNVPREPDRGVDLGDGDVAPFLGL